MGETQLDRIERKLDKIIAATPVSAKPGAAAATVDPWAPIAAAQSLGEMERNAMLGYDAEGFRHRSHFPGETSQYEGSLEDALQELRDARLNPGDYLDFGPEQILGRFKDFASCKEAGSLRGLVVRYILLTNLVPTAKERALTGSGQLVPNDGETFKDMTSDQFWWMYIMAQRAAHAGMPGAGASGGDAPSSLPTSGGSGSKS